MTRGPTAVVSAMHEELRALLPLLQNPRQVTLGGRRFHLGDLHGRPVVLVLSGIGKVAAAATAVLLIQAFDAAELLLTGVAGGLHAGVEVGDVVLARQLLQHDMDASPLFPRYEVPLTGRARFDADPVLGSAVERAAAACLGDAAALVGDAELRAFGIGAPRLHCGLIVSGDRFVARAADSAELRSRLPDALAVEMEGAALAQVCADFGRPFAVLRTISDRADDSAHVDFQRFIAEVASRYSAAIVSAWFAARERA